ncbi:MAG: RNA polymerase sigma factor [Bacteroidales bacterium]|nr:RNA polymerase sigma factor [Bacteroidales bacterium]
MKNDENSVIRRILAGNIQEYELLVRNYQAAVYHVLYQMLQQHEEAEELAQEVFVKAYEKLETFNYRSKFFSWIYRIAINTAISHIKKSQRFVRLERLPEDAGRNPDSVDKPVMEKERDVMLQRAMGELGENYRAVIVLHYFKELSYAEIAEVLDLSEKKVKSRLYDGRKLLKGILERQGFFESSRA